MRTLLRSTSRTTLGVFLVLVLSLFPAAALAQTAVEFNRWDARITARSESDELQIAETQEIRVTGGTLNRGTRFWTRPVQVQNVFVVLGSDATPIQLTAGDGVQRGTYALAQSGTQATLTYTLPTPQNSGATFIVQINYMTTSPTRGLVDWRVVPAEHDFTVKSSTVRITFPAGQAPDATLIRSSQANATAQVSGNDVVVQSGSPLAPREAFSIQVPFGTGVGAASGSGGGSQDPGLIPPEQPAAPTDGTIELPGIGSIAVILCIFGVLVLFGGGNLLRGLLGRGLSGGGLTGSASPGGLGGLGGLFGGSRRSGSTPDPFTSSSPSDNAPVERGFRASPDQNRSIGKVGNDKDSGGGASFS